MNSSPPRSLLILIEGTAWPSDLQPLVQALQQQGAQVTVQTCAQPYAEVLDNVEATNTVLFWR